MQELYRLLWSADPVCLPQLSSTLQALQSKQRTVKGTVSSPATWPVLNDMCYRIPGAIFFFFFSVYHTKTIVHGAFSILI